MILKILSFLLLSIFLKAFTYTTNNLVNINPSGVITKGCDQVLKEVKNVHQTFLKGVSMTIDTISVRFLTFDVAVANVIHKICNFQSPDGVKHEN